MSGASASISRIRSQIAITMVLETADRLHARSNARPNSILDLWRFALPLGHELPDVRPIHFADVDHSLRVDRHGRRVFQTLHFLDDCAVLEIGNVEAISLGAIDDI